MIRNVNRRSIGLSNTNRRGSVQGVSPIVGVSGLGVSGSGKASAKGACEYIRVLYDTRTHITQRKCTASLNCKPDDRLNGILRITGYNTPVGPDGRIKPNPSSDMWSYWIEKEKEKSQEGDRKLQIRLDFDGDRMIGWMARPTPKFAKLSFSMSVVSRSITVDKIESTLNPKDLSKFDKDPTILQEGIPTGTPIQNMRMGPDKSENYLKERGDG